MAVRAMIVKCGEQQEEEYYEVPAREESETVCIVLRYSKAPSGGTTTVLEAKKPQICKAVNKGEFERSSETEGNELGAYRDGEGSGIRRIWLDT